MKLLLTGEEWFGIVICQYSRCILGILDVILLIITIYLGICQAADKGCY